MVLAPAHRVDMGAAGVTPEQKERNIHKYIHNTCLITSFLSEKNTTSLQHDCIFLSFTDRTAVWLLDAFARNEKKRNPARGNKVDYGEYEQSLLCACVCVFCSAS